MQTSYMLLNQDKLQAKLMKNQTLEFLISKL